MSSNVSSVGSALSARCCADTTTSEVCITLAIFLFETSTALLVYQFRDAG